ncbi:transposase [Acuticoccus kandeliae]|uniref:transposase n=1 Tax=Acuticoccus kandeliae TaxID=2073160 RepID=UPI001300544B|nr:transposase [Acuticoccus kandeliae]
MRTVPGIDPTVHATLLGERPEFGALDRRRIASSAGLAPHVRESGTWRGHPSHRGRSQQGSRGALHRSHHGVATDSEPLCNARPDAPGGPGAKTILIALARQRLVTHHAMERNGKPIAT